jgi:hypothetical protein
MGNLPNLTPPLCGYCGKPARLISRKVRFKRGDQALPVDSWAWECPSNCKDPYTGGQPFRFMDEALLHWEEGEAKAAWKKRFGADLPPADRPRRRFTER